MPTNNDENNLNKENVNSGNYMMNRKDNQSNDSIITDSCNSIRSHSSSVTLSKNNTKDFINSIVGKERSFYPKN